MQGISYTLNLLALHIIFKSLNCGGMKLKRITVKIVEVVKLLKLLLMDSLRIETFNSLLIRRESSY